MEVSARAMGEGSAKLDAGGAAEIGSVAPFAPRNSVESLSNLLRPTMAHLVSSLDTTPLATTPHALGRIPRRVDGMVHLVFEHRRDVTRQLVHDIRVQRHLVNDGLTPWMDDDVERLQELNALHDTIVS